jgi:hypothetical protein
MDLNNTKNLKEADKAYKEAKEAYKFYQNILIS